jgi:hypothetical protein
MSIGNFAIAYSLQAQIICYRNNCNILKRIYYKQILIASDDVIGFTVLVNENVQRCTEKIAEKGVVHRSYQLNRYLLTI